MIGIKVLLENTGADRGYRVRHGLSLAVANGEGDLLLDVGPDATFASNASRMGVDLGRIRTLVLSHAHRDHTGGLDAFCAANADAKILLFDRIDSEYSVKLLWKLGLPVGLPRSAGARKRIESLESNRRVDAKTWFIRNTVHLFPKPRYNANLYKRVERGMIPDAFDHEGILVVEDEGELVVLNSCSHNGVINTVESVKAAFKGKKVRAYVGGFHFSDPITRRHEDERALDGFADYVRRSGIRFYTGHCTGEYCSGYLESKLGGLLTTFRTGAELLV